MFGRPASSRVNPRPFSRNARIRLRGCPDSPHQASPGGGEPGHHVVVIVLRPASKGWLYFRIAVECREKLRGAFSQPYAPGPQGLRCRTARGSGWRGLANVLPLAVNSSATALTTACCVRWLRGLGGRHGFRICIVNRLERGTSSHLCAKKSANSGAQQIDQPSAQPGAVSANAALIRRQDTAQIENTRRTVLVGAQVRGEDVQHLEFAENAGPRH